MSGADWSVMAVSVVVYGVLLTVFVAILDDLRRGLRVRVEQDSHRRRA